MSEQGKKKTCVVYARVSTEEQEREGYSIDAQLSSLQDYAKRKRFSIAETFIDSETARITGRTGFNKMRSYLIDNPDCRIILVEKTDRLSRNHRDYLSLDVEHTGLEIHFVRDRCVFNKDSSATEFFNLDIQLAQASFFSRNLSAEAKKGMRAKAEKGQWPSYAPIGYLNERSAQGGIIVTDPVRAPLIRKLYEKYASGVASVSCLVQYAQTIGLTSRRHRKLEKSTIHRVLTNPIYMGEFEWKGQKYHGTHEPIVSTELWQSVQDLLTGRNKQKVRRTRREFAYRGLIKCGTCGCSVVGEQKKGKYNYYHCTQYRMKHPEPWLKEEILDDYFIGLLERLTLDPEVVEWIVDSLREDSDEAIQSHQESLERLGEQRDRLRQRLDTAYNDRLDGRIDAETYDGKAEEINTEIRQIDRSISDLGDSPDTDLPLTAQETLELAQEAYTLFLTAPPTERRQLLQVLLSNCVLTRGELDTELSHLYAILADTNAIWQEKKAAGAENLDIRSIWYP